MPDWRGDNLPPPPNGYRWYCETRGNCVLVNIRTGVVRRTHWNEDREDYWRRRYQRRYSYQDDIYYRECRGSSDPAGIILGGLIGGLIGHVAGDGREGATIAGIIIGGTLGAVLTRDMDCDDRSYAYAAFYHGLNDGRVGVIHRWNNPRSRHHGEFHVRNYYYDGDGFRCANYRHTSWTNERRRFDGRACRQPDGAWIFLN